MKKLIYTIGVMVLLMIPATKSLVLIDKQPTIFTIKQQVETIPDFDRSEWGSWNDEDGDCQNTRAEILIRDAIYVVGETDCIIKDGLWITPYANKAVHYANRLDIDHFVPLEHAHTHGGYRWTKEKKQEFARDPENLIAVTLSENRSKGARGISEWMPKNYDYWCEYIFKWQYLKSKYDLYISEDEKQMIKIVTRTCEEY